MLGSFLTYVALPFQIKELTGSYLAVGLIGAVELVPLIVFGLWGGALADAVDRRRLVLLSELGLGLLSLLLLVSGLFRSTLWNQTIPDELRGRPAGIELLSFSVGPQSGQVRAGAVASLVGVRASIWSGGLLCVASVGLLAAALPRLMSYDARTDGHAVRMRELRAAREQPQL